MMCLPHEHVLPGTFCGYIGRIEGDWRYHHFGGVAIGVTRVWRPTACWALRAARKRAAKRWERERRRAERRAAKRCKIARALERCP